MSFKKEDLDLSTEPRRRIIKILLSIKQPHLASGRAEPDLGFGRYSPCWTIGKFGKALSRLDSSYHQAYARIEKLAKKEKANYQYLRVRLRADNLQLLGSRLETDDEMRDRLWQRRSVKRAMDRSELSRKKLQVREFAAEHPTHFEALAKEFLASRANDSRKP